MQSAVKYRCALMKTFQHMKLPINKSAKKIQPAVHGLVTFYDLIMRLEGQKFIFGASHHHSIEHSAHFYLVTMSGAKTGDCFQNG